MFHLRQLAGELLRFAGVGGMATATHLGVAWAALAMRLPPYAANGIGFGVAVWISYLGHTHVTFRRSGRFGRLFTVALAGFAFNNVILALLLQWQLLTETAALALAILAVPLATFIGLRVWAFQPSEAENSRD